MVAKLIVGVKMNLIFRYWMTKLTNREEEDGDENMKRWKIRIIDGERMNSWWNKKGRRRTIFYRLYLPYELRIYLDNCSIIETSYSTNFLFFFKFCTLICAWNHFGQAQRINYKNVIFEWFLSTRYEAEKMRLQIYDVDTWDLDYRHELSPPSEGIKFYGPLGGSLIAGREDEKVENYSNSRLYFYVEDCFV